MPSRALRRWQTRSRKVLDEFEAAHALFGGAGVGRRFARQQIAQAYVVLLCSQFQRFCRELHAQAIEKMTDDPAHAPLNPILRRLLSTGRRLDVGNASPSMLGSDFGRLGLSFWDKVREQRPSNEARQQQLAELNRWRNAIAHQDFSNAEFEGASEVKIAQVRRWRRACEALAVEFDAVLRLYLSGVIGRPPW
jgi:hypothetical protein